MVFSGEMRRCNHLAAELDAVYHSIAKSMGMSDSEMMILYTVYGNGGSYPLKDIALFSGVSKQTINSGLRKLEKSGEVSLSSEGTKNKRVSLTEKGEARCKKTVERLICAENEVFSSWSSEDVCRYLELSERFLTDMKTKAKEI